MRLEGLTKKFGDLTAVDSLDLTIPAGSFFALLGPSGCGKTTTLRMIGGFETPTRGQVWLGDRDITDLKAYRRPINTVFQNYALFPHLSVFENVAFGLRRTGERGEVLHSRVNEMLELVQLPGFEHRRPNQLSGGQQQRVALARALINHPKVLLLDEPLGALDLKLRKGMQLELKRIQTDVGVTFVHVTHDQEEAMTMADSIAVMNAGQIEQFGSPMELYERPQTEFVADFLGQSNLLEGRVVGRDETEATVAVGDSKLRVPGLSGTGGRARVGVRPEKIRIVPADAGNDREDRNTVHGTIIDASFVGVSSQFVVRVPWGQELTVFAQNLGDVSKLAPGTDVLLQWDPAHCFVVEAS